MHCYFEVTKLIIFVLFKVPLRNWVKLAPLEQALLFKSQRCSNVLAIFSHSFPMGHLGEAPIIVTAKSRKCSMSREPKGVDTPSAWSPGLWENPGETLPGTQDLEYKHCTSPAATWWCCWWHQGNPGDNETQRAFWDVSSQLQHTP